jgi:two-component system cell cycle response regulator CpdR
MAKKILVVDDEALILKAVERALARVGYTVAAAQNMKELARALMGESYDLLITDVYMEGGTFDEVVEMVRGKFPEVKVLKMSGAADKREEGNFIEKPFSIKTLRQRVKEILNESS